MTALHVRRGKNNSYGNKVNTAAFAALAFRSAEAARTPRAINWLISPRTTPAVGVSPTQEPSDADSTGTVLQVIHGKKNIRPAMNFLNKARSPPVDGRPVAP